MESKHQNTETQKQQPNEEQQAVAVSVSVAVPPPFATLSLSTIQLSLSTILNPNTFFQQPKIFNLFSHAKTKIPTQASSLTLSTTTAKNQLSLSKKISSKSTISANPLQNPLTLPPQRPLDPNSIAGYRKTSIVWFRNDLRVHDNECLSSANSESMAVLPVYCFDPRDYGKSSSGFDKTGPARARFVIESVSDLRRSLQAKGSDLVVRVGRPESVLVELAKEVGARAVYAHREVSKGEVEGENRIEVAMKEEDVEVKYFWGSTLYHVDDLPFKVEDMPVNYGGFKEKVKGVSVRETIAAVEQLKGLPSQGDVDVGKIPTLTDLGVSSAGTTSQGGKMAANTSMIGGETEAQQKLKKFAAECQAQPNKVGKDSIYGANFSCKISPWLATGCLSPRFVFDELKKTASSTISSAINRNDGATGSSNPGSNWLMYELMWRDFFRFITKKYSSVKKQFDAAPATACAGALA